MSSIHNECGADICTPKTRFNEADVTLVRFIVNKFSSFPSAERRDKVLSFYNLPADASDRALLNAIELEVATNFDLPPTLASKCARLIHDNALTTSEKLGSPDLQMLRWLPVYRQFSPQNVSMRNASHLGPGRRCELEAEIEADLITMFDVSPKLVHRFVELILNRK